MTSTNIATFGAGCYWCVEAIFEKLIGVDCVRPGFMGGDAADSSYEAVCSGTTAHAEVCRIEFDPEKISFARLLEVFWQTHDPTTLNRQGADVGTQYRSVIFYHDEVQHRIAVEQRLRLDDAHVFSAKIVTEISPAYEFFPAPDNHAQYFLRNPEAGYCRAVIAPKVENFRQAFADDLKPSRSPDIS